MSSPSIGGGGRKRGRPLMDTAVAATSVKQGSYGRTCHRMVHGDRTYVFHVRRIRPDPLDRFQTGIPLPRYLTRPDPEEEDDQEREAEENTTNRKRACIPASSKAVLGLQEVSAGDASLQAECAVCLRDFCAEDTLRAMPCAHAFHRDCIFGWLRVNHFCPLCRHALPTQQQDDDEEEEQYYQPASMPVPEEA